jgi:hypothetical protein
MIVKLAGKDFGAALPIWQYHTQLASPLPGNFD